MFSPSVLPLLEAGGRAGGAELDVWQIATALSRDPTYRTWLAAIGDANERRVAGAMGILSIARYRPERTRRGHFVRYCLRVVRSLRSVDADVYFCKGASLEAVLCFAAARIGRRRRFVFRLQHDWETAPDTLTARLFAGQRLLARCFIAAVRRADAVVTQTLEQQRALRKHLGLDSTVLYNSHPVPDFPLLGEKRSVLWIGRAASYKRPDAFLTLASRLPDYPFVMVATFDANHPSVLASLRERSATLPNVTLLEGASRDEIDRLFRQARVYVLSSQAEGFPNVLVEACRSATPVVSLRVDPDALIRQHDAGIVADDDLEALTRGVEAVLTDDALFERLGRNAYALARERLNIDRTIGAYKMLFSAEGPTGD